MRVGLVGPSPPPYGGVSVHMQRLKLSLENQGFEVIIFNSNIKGVEGEKTNKIRHLKWLFQFITCSPLDLLHMHSENWYDRAFLVLIGRIRKIKTIVTFHSLRDDLRKMSLQKRLSASYLVKHVDYIIVAGENEKEKLVKHYNLTRHIDVINAFITPILRDVELTVDLTDFIHRHSFIISANASNMNYHLGQEVYGLDMLVELCGALKLERKVGLIYCLSNVADRDYLEKIKARIKELHIEESFLIFTGTIEFWPVLEKSHLFIRPTSTDSYGVSVAEALTLGVPSVASDVCQRPDGTILFQSRNSQDLLEKVLEVINNYEHHSSIIKNLKIADCTPDIIKIYQKL